MANTVVGLYSTSSVAQEVIDDLIDNGFDRGDVDLEETARGDLASELTRGGVPQDDADYYADGVRDGGSLVVLRAPEAKTSQAVDIMERHSTRDADFINNADRDLDTTADRDTDRDTTANTARTTRNDGDQTLDVVEERLRVGKRIVERGGVRVRTSVTETPVEQDVTLRDETIHVDRRPVDRAASDADFDAFEERTIEVTETDEEAVVSKEARVVEEVVIGKTVEDRHETVRDTVRRTDVDVEEIGADRSRDNDYRNYDNDFRQHYETTGSKSDYSYEQSEPAYRYGYTLANDDRYSGRDWNDVEPDARREWESRNEGTWDNFKDSVRYSWERARGRA